MAIVSITPIDARGLRKHGHASTQSALRDAGRTGEDARIETPLEARTELDAKNNAGATPGGCPGREEKAMTTHAIIASNDDEASVTAMLNERYLDDDLKVRCAKRRNEEAPAVNATETARK